MDARFEPLGADGSDDLQYVIDLLQDCFAGHSADLLAVEIARATDLRIGAGVVCRVGGRVAGVALFRQPRAGVLFIVYLAVQVEFRRRGLGRRLVDAVVRTAGVDRVELFVDADNLGARRLYVDSGLAESGSDAPLGQVHLAGRWRPTDLALASKASA